MTNTFWLIPALGGFPGAYMKEVGNWFSTDDFLNLMKDKSDRSITALDSIAYTDDGVNTKLFTIELTGIIAHKPYANPAYASLDAVVLFDNRYLGEYIETGDMVPSELKEWNGFKQFLTSQ